LFGIALSWFAGDIANALAHCRDGELGTQPLDARFTVNARMAVL